jgi:hypothetical protein
MSNNPENPDNLEIPAYEIGGYVRETGIALVHEGEYIIPAAGSEAKIDAVSQGNQVINYYFPVEIVIVGSLPQEEREAMEASIWEQLSNALERLT